MAQHVKVMLVDDVDGGEADETVRFGIDGVSYEIDLSEAHAMQLRSALHPFLEKARKDRSGKVRRGTARAASTRERSAEIRKWATDNGVSVNERGRIPATVIEQYEAAH